MAQRVERALSFLGNKTKSSASLLDTPHRGNRDFPTDADAYELLEDCGRGVSATVWRAVCTELNEEVAVKLLDMENMNCSLEEIVREAQTMRQLNHINVLPLHCSFVHKQNLWMVMPYVAGGSVLNIMKYAYPEGLEEPVVATILKEVLKGLEYIHRQGCIHRDIKAGNILIDKDGTVFLADFGVSASLERTGSWGHSQAARNTFVGTPCWMAPEVMEQTQGYGPLADIWSFGITILELAHGHAPFAKLPPMKVLLMTIQNPPPTLETDSGKKHFSKAMRDIVAKCLVKDPTKRPTAAQLLEHKFFKTAHDSSYLVKHLLAGLPPLPERVRQMRQGTAADPKVQAAEMQRSQEAYMRGVSGWNFDVEELKRQAQMEEVSKAPGLATVPEGVAMPMVAPTPAPAHPAPAPVVQAPVANGAAPPPASFPTVAVNAPSAAAAPPAAAGGRLTVEVGTPSHAAAAATAGSHAAKPPIAASPSHGRSGSSEFLPGSAGGSVPGSVPASAAATPTRALPPGSTAVPGAAAALGARPTLVHKKQGRFDVYESDAAEETSDGSIVGMGVSLDASRSHSATSELPPVPATAVESSSGPVPSTSAAAAGDNPEKAKRKGRFHIVEEDGFPGDKRVVPRASSAASLAADMAAKAGVSAGAPPVAGAGPSGAPGVGGPPAPGVGSVPGVGAPAPASALLGPLKELQEQLAGPYELLRELVAAVQDADRGKQAHLNSLLQERLALRAQREDGDKLRTEVTTLREENGKLRDKLRMLESKLQRIQLESQTPVPSPPRLDDVRDSTSSM